MSNNLTSKTAVWTSRVVCASIITLVSAGLGCGETTPPPRSGDQLRDRATSAEPPDSAADAAEGGQASQREPDPVALPPITPVRLADGSLAIRRAELERLVSTGANNFISLVDVRPVLRRRRFRGWRVVDYRGPGALQPGDIVGRVNRKSIERPEQFMEVWASLAKRDELVIELRRAGRRATLRFPIID